MDTATFVASERALSLALTARTFGVSPSRTYLGLDDPVLVAAVDEALAMRLMALAAEDGPDPVTGVVVAPDSAYGDDS